MKNTTKRVVNKTEFFDYLIDHIDEAFDCTLKFWLQEAFPFQNLTNDCINALIVVLKSGEWIFLPSLTSARQRETILGVKLLMVHKWAMLPALGNEDNPATASNRRRGEERLVNRTRNLDGHTIINEQK